MEKGLFEKLITEQGENGYSTEVEVSASVKGYDVDPIKVAINWSMDMEARSWGIKSIEAFPRPESRDFEFTATNVDSEEEFPDEVPLTLIVDMGQLKVEWERAGYLAPISVELYADTAGVIDYNLSHITFGYLTKE